MRLGFLPMARKVTLSGLIDNVATVLSPSRTEPFKITQKICFSAFPCLLLFMARAAKIRLEWLTSPAVLL